MTQHTTSTTPAGAHPHRIAIIAFGSLIWDEECLAPHITGGWQLGAGPRLPVEFCRVSPKRQRALALTIDPALPHAVPTAYTLSRRADIADAVADLARRERCARQYIGICQRGGAFANLAEPIAGRIHAWLTTQPHLRAAIVAALPLNFREETGLPFTLRNAVEHLRALPAKSLAEAWRYITFAPHQTNTPLRRHLNSLHWWRMLNHHFRQLHPVSQPD